MKIQIADTDERILFCFDVMYELRTHLVKENFLEQVRRMQKEKFMIVYIEQDGKAICAAGFRMEEMLHRGKSIYVDDLVTLSEYRSKGAGGKMMDWIIDFAKKNNCKQIHLDSGVQRFDAHRFYLSKGFVISSHHFVLKLDV